MGMLIVSEHGKDAREFLISREEVRIGRDPNGEIVLADIGASRQHARIVQRSGSLILEDLGSRNGTVINNTKIRAHETRLLCDGDEIQIGRSILRLVLESVGTNKVGNVNRARPSPVQPTLRDVDARAEDEPVSLFSLRKIEGSLLILDPGSPVRRCKLTKDRIRIGRTAKADIVLSDLTVSAEHAEIMYNNEGFHLVDRDSRWGTFQNGQPVRIARLQNGSYLRFGKVQALFTFREGENEPPVPSFTLRDDLIEAYPERATEIQETFRLCCAQPLNFGEEIVARGVLEPEQWWIVAARSRTNAKGRNLLGWLFRRRQNES